MNATAFIRRLGWTAYRLIAKHHRFASFDGLRATVNLPGLAGALSQEGEAGAVALAFLNSVADDPQMNAQVAWAAGWGKFGLPQVSPDQKLLASWMATSASPEAIEGTKLPWPFFSIVVPPGWMFTTSSEGRHAVTRICVSSAEGRCRLALVDEALVITGAKAAPVEDLADLQLRTTDPVWSMPGETIDDNDVRLLRLAGLAVLGVAFEFEARRSVPALPSRLVSTGPGVAPAVADVRLHRTVSVDARVAVRAFAAEGGRSPVVRSCVRGHWKMQPHGPQRSERKRIHVEPYWRGPDGAPEVEHTYQVRNAS